MMTSQDFPALPGSTPPPAANNSMGSPSAAGCSWMAQENNGQASGPFDPNGFMQGNAPSYPAIITAPDGNT